MSVEYYSPVWLVGRAMIIQLTLVCIDTISHNTQMNKKPPSNHSGREFVRFVEFVGSLKDAAAFMDITPDMLTKLRKGERRVSQHHVWALAKYPGFKLSLKRLFDLDRAH